MNRIALVVRALYQGAQLAQVETWKKTGVATAAVTGLLAAFAGLAVSFDWLDSVPTDLIAEVSSAIVAIVSGVLVYLQVATTEKIGLRGRGTGTDRVLHDAAAADPGDESGRDSDVARNVWLDFNDD